MFPGEDTTQGLMYSQAIVRGKFSRAMLVAKWCHALIEINFLGDKVSHGTTRAKSFGKLVKLSLKNPNPLKRRRRSWSVRLSPQGAPFGEPEESSSNVSEAPREGLLTASSLSGEARSRKFCTIVLLD